MRFGIRGLGWVLVLGVLCSSCTSFYSSSIVGHESLTLPIPTSPKRLSAGLDLRTAPTGSIFTSDSAQTAMVSGFLRARLTDEGSPSVYLLGSVSEYYALTSLTERSGWLGNSSTITAYSGFGTVLALRPSVVMKSGGNTMEFGLEALYNQELGAYKDYRSTLGGPDDRLRVDLSPGGKTASASFDVKVTRDANLTLGAGLGYAVFDTAPPYQGNGLGKFSALYSFGAFWAAACVQTMFPLNVSLALSFGGETR